MQLVGGLNRSEPEICHKERERVGMCHLKEGWMERCVVLVDLGWYRAQAARTWGVSERKSRPLKKQAGSMDGNFKIEGLASRNEAKKISQAYERKRSRENGDEAAVDGLYRVVHSAPLAAQFRPVSYYEDFP